MTTVKLFKIFALIAVLILGSGVLTALEGIPWVIGVVVLGVSLGWFGPEWVRKP